MIAVDTNVIVSLVTRDDPDQAEAARRLFLEADRLWLAKTVLLETEWVLRYSYDLDPETIRKTLRKLLGFGPLQFEDRRAVEEALEWHAQGLDFADALHLASSSEAKTFATFDHKFAKRAGKLREIELL